MLSLLIILFWLSLFIVIYSYAIYPAVLKLLAGLFGRPVKADAAYAPTVGVVIPVYNEELVIREKILNILSLEYPTEKLSLWVGSDRSVDGTESIVREFMGDPRIHLWIAPSRNGKTIVLNRLVPMVDADIVLFTDADIMLRRNSLKNIVRNFADPAVGAVGGNTLHVVRSGAATEESKYRSFEANQKTMEARLHSTISLFGSFFAIRKSLFLPIPPNAYSNDDVLIPMNVIRQGYRVAFEPEAVSEEEMAPSLSLEFKRRVRIGAGNFQAFLWLLDFLNPLRGWPCFCYLSHKACRWFSPLLILLGFLCCGIIAFSYDVTAYRFLFCLATGIVIIGLSYLFIPLKQIKPVFYFLAMNFALVLGLFRYLSGIRSAVWSPPRRRGNV
jgi:cellulose synthase/poly-beta-1,6-N-acetylglucosamine synthase-like glycosyltransferase